MTIHAQTPEPFSMSRAFTPRRLLLAVLLVALSALVLLGQSFRVFDRAWFAVQEWRHADAWKERSIWLPDYRVRIEAQPIEGLNDDVSALTFDPDRRTLFTVTNQPAQIIELSLQGKVLRTIPLTGFGDAEAIEYISRGVYVITDERQQRLVKVRLEDDTRFIDAADAQQLSLGIGLNGNKGFEGLAYDAEGKRLFVAKERDPVRIYEIHGFPHTQADKPFAVHVVDDPGRDKRLFVRDLSSLQFDEGTGHLLALSDESRLVVELDTDGEPVSTLSLLRGMHGLKRSVPQAEGVAMDERGVLYLVSEPNLFYVFSKDEPAQP
ncbi:SdiA-regulated domain-containing protein [Pseudomonas aeruginosa]|uniref:SdiA-regulated domain-containing protein n=1 Tax=Pseudomonas TaxID=286 RepID=UPI0009A41481|nr:YjiK family protein [Pseudomonas aeruginosa]HBP6264765.1 DNA-binding protein [Pseudomonas aeruginosa]HEJ1150428.1 YjiK family protein [Pseudomonas aeruginosa]